MSTKYYDPDGILIKSNNNTSLKCACERSDHYFVLINNEGLLYNPCDTNTKIKQFSLKKCSKSCYNMYVKFLSSKNRKYLNTAQRSFLNG
jgi:hypothetical protein